MTENKPEKSDMPITAAMIIIGDEILSGRTQDANLSHFAKELNEMGIQIREARVIPDVEQEIADTVNELRAKHNYVFTTGGIGPTHDDITADSVALAFGVSLYHHPDALAAMEARHGPDHLNEARRRMARVPEGGELIENPVSTAPGFRIENVYVMAGIPIIAQAMLESVRHNLAGGNPVVSTTVSAHLAEGQIAEGLGKIQLQFPQVSIGSYPFYIKGKYGASLVMRSVDTEVLAQARQAVIGLIGDLGGEPIEGEPT